MTTDSKYNPAWFLVVKAAAAKAAAGSPGQATLEEIKTIAAEVGQQTTERVVSRLKTNLTGFDPENLNAQQANTLLAYLRIERRG